MVGRDNVTFSFRIDSAKASAAIKELTRVLEKLGGTVQTTSGKIKQTSNATRDLGNNAAASAVNFQTATQGALNLSTAMVQTYTSISNLDRANNRAKMSIIAVARAEDLLANKQQRATEMREAGTSGGQKYVNILREIETAEADLTVKIEKKGIEQDAVNDIYMLFATNIANVTISSIQTIAILDRKQILLTKAKIVVQKISNASMFTSAKATYAASAATILQGKAAVVTTGATLGLTGAVHALTAATRAFMASNPLLLAAMAVSVGLFALHESNILGSKTALDELLGVEKDFESQVKDSRDAVGEMNDALGEHENKLFSLPSTYSGLVRELETIKGKYQEVTAVVKDNTSAIIVNNSYHGSKRPSPNFSSGGITTQQTTTGNNQTSDGLSIQLPMAYADGPSSLPELKSRFTGDVIKDRVNDLRHPSGTGLEHKLGLIDGANAPIFGFTKTTDGSYMPQGPSSNTIIQSFMNQAIREGGQDIALSLGVSTEEGIEIYMNDPDFEKVKARIILNVIQNKLSGTDKQKFKVFTPDSYVDFKRDEAFKKVQKDAKESIKNKMKMLGKETRMRGSMRQLFQTFGGGLAKSDSLFKGTLDNSALKKLGGVRYVQGKLVYQEKNARLAPSMLRRALQGKAGSFDEDDPFDQLLRQTITSSGGKQFKNKDLSNIFDYHDWSDSRKAAFDKSGVDIGKAADNYSKADAERIGVLQKMASHFQGGGGRASVALASVGGNATQAYQVKSVNWAGKSAWKANLARGDSFVNGLGGVIMNVINYLKGGRLIHSSGHRGITTQPEGSAVISKALQYGIKGMPEWMDMINQIPAIDIESEDNYSQAYASLNEAVSIASQYVSLVDTAKGTIGFSATTLAKATAAGFGGTSLYENISLLAATKRTNFSNTQIIEESKSKLSLTNSQTFAIRFNSTRGDAELQDRFRYVDQLEAMSSGTSPL